MANPSIIDEYGAQKGGVCYYTQNRFGTEWFNNADNKKGWTIDLNLRVSDVQNSEWFADENKKGNGIGLYVNDGTRQETINFLTQEIILSNANQSVIYDATAENDYRIIGKGDNLKLYAKSSDSSSYSELLNANFSEKATVSGNALNPVIFEDVSGNLHASWWDDGNNVGSLFYSKFNGTVWSEPEVIVVSDNGIQFPSIMADSNENIYVVFESKQTEGSVIGIVYKNDIGWSDPYYTGQDIGYCKYPKPIFDSQSNICVVWEDSRQTHPETYIDIFIINENKWRGEEEISTNTYGSFRPSIASYMDDLFISWTAKKQNNSSYIEVIKYNAISAVKVSPVIVSDSYNQENILGKADHSSILANVEGKIFVVWHDNAYGEYQIFTAILTPSLDMISGGSTTIDGRGGAMYPVLSEQLSTGNIYIVWQDFKTGDYREFNLVTNPSDPYFDTTLQENRPSSSALFVAVYENDSFNSSVMLVFNDDRNAYSPGIPTFFNGELPIVYESYLTSENKFVFSQDRLLKAKCAFYNLSRDSSTISINYGVDIGVDPNSPSFGNRDRDYTLNKSIFTKEIRFGDFSDVLNAHYVFKEIKYYLNDAVEPYAIKELGVNTLDVNSLSAHDAIVNNYGDVWLLGPCGMFYYINRQNRLVSVGEGHDLPGFVNASGDQQADDEEGLQKLRAIAFDKNNNMYIGGREGVVRYGTDHINGFKSLVLPGISSEVVTSIVFDKDNKMFVGTDSGLYIYDNVVVEDVVGTIPPALGIIAISTTYTNPACNGEYITCLRVDENNCVWIGTKENGLYRFYKDNFIQVTTTNGLSSNIINDIAIRNTAIRYIATSSGINKMVGFNFDNTISSKDDTIWNNNVKSIVWKDPNILFAGSMSAINQIIVNDDEDTYSTLFYRPSSITADGDDFSVYYVLDEGVSISNDSIVEVYINGNRINYGYNLSYNDDVAKLIKFRMPLNNDDVVEAVVRSDLEEIASFAQTQIEKENMGGNLIRITDIEFDGSDIYVATTGNDNEVKVNDSSSVLPFDKIHLDTLPPSFPTDVDGITIDRQVDRSIVKVLINGATDNVLDGDVSTGDILVEGSGIDRMIVSNYDNFTTDGVTSQSSVPFSTSLNHDLGISLESITKEITFPRGMGTVVTYISPENELYGATSNPAIVYKYNWVTEAWESLFTYDDDGLVDFIAKYNDKLLVSIGHDIEPAKIYIYNYLGTELVEFDMLTVFESRAYCFHELDGKFYIGSGIGSGNEYAEGAGQTGAVYLFNDGTAQNIDPSLSKVVEEIDENVYSLTSVAGSSNLLAATGPEGYIYEIDIENEAAFIVYNSTESLTSISYLDREGNVFVGGLINGTVRRSVAGNNTYDISFRTAPASINSIKVFPVVVSGTTISSYSSVYAAVGNTLYYLSEAGSWTWKYTHNEDIIDIAFNDSQNKNTLYVISDTGITKLDPLLQNKTIYLKLIDRAGNETILGSDLTVTNKFIDSISISDLVDFVNENKILELDELGNTSYTLTGDNKFYSADKIDEERGEYLSEIFDGTNDLVKWETISWQATELFNTQAIVYIRSSTSQNDILIADWVGPFYNYQSSGVDISHLVGQFIQFKVVLISTEKGITPSFHRASIRAITSESIHFFTTNFTMPSRIERGIITSRKVIPVSADIVFGINTTNSIDWTEYQPVDENRIFNVTQTGTNLRVGIKLISPNRSLIEPVEFDEYGPYNSNLFVNTIDFSLENNTGTTNSYHFRITLYEDAALLNPVFSAYSLDSSEGFSVNSIAIPEEGVVIGHGAAEDMLFAVPGFANIVCNTYYFVKIEYIYDSEFVVLSNDDSFIASCTASFIDTVDFNFTNNEGTSNYYHFRIKFYQDLERTSEYLTVFSGNDRSGWFVEDVQIPEDGSSVSAGESVNVVYRPTPTDFTVGTIYYLTIEAHDGGDYVFASNSYTFQVRDIQSTESCGGYEDVPIVNNFGIMVELDNNEFVTLNI